MTAKGLSLHIGLNHVDPAGYEGWDGELAACVRDATDMAGLAVSLGYDATTLVDDKATARAVNAWLTSAAGQVSAGDSVLVSYSGHGGQVPDRNRDESTIEAGESGGYLDRYDETWCLWDRQLVDDELAAAWAKFPAKVTIYVFSDSCHSGTVTRMLPAAAKWGPPRRMPLDVEDAVYAARKKTYDAIQRRYPTKDKARIVASVGLISGCQDNQLSSDGPVNGLFTGTLLRTWSSPSGEFTGSFSKLRRVVALNMPAEQTPNYYTVGAASRVFTTRAALRI